MNDLGSEAPACKLCGVAEQKDALGWSNMAHALEICVECINAEIQRFQAAWARPARPLGSGAPS
jgi:hypothetical protein